MVLEELVSHLQKMETRPLLYILYKNIDLKQVVNTNKCLIHLEKHGDKLLVISCIDNLLKGAVSFAMNTAEILRILKLLSKYNL